MTSQLQLQLRTTNRILFTQLGMDEAPFQPSLRQKNTQRISVVPTGSPI